MKRPQHPARWKLRTGLRTDRRNWEAGHHQPTIMSRSKRKNPVFGMTGAESEAQDKRIWHKRMRAKMRQLIHHDPDPQPLHDNAAGDVWGMAKDGKHWWFPRQLDMFAKLMRK